MAGQVCHDFLQQLVFLVSSFVWWKGTDIRGARDGRFESVKMSFTNGR